MFPQYNLDIRMEHVHLYQAGLYYTDIPLSKDISKLHYKYYIKNAVEKV